MTTRPGFLHLTLRTGEARTHVPCHADCLVGAARPATRLDGGGPLDRALGGSGQFRVRAMFHARGSLGRLGQQASGFQDDEEVLGLSRTYIVELADPDFAQWAVDGLRGRREVESAAGELLCTAHLEPVRDQRGRPSADEALAPYTMVGAPGALRVEPGMAEVSIAVVDTGVRLGHPELTGRLLAGADLVDLGMGQVAGGLQLVGDTTGFDDTPEDDVGHGTHVAGVVAASGQRIPPGLAGQCRVLPVRVLAAARTSPTSRPFGIGSVSTISAGIKQAVDGGAAVVNLSLGTSLRDVEGGAPLPHADVCAYAEQRGVVLVAASGNDGTLVPFLPAALPTVLAVGSVDRDGRVSSFTSSGPHVVLHAPGESIVGLGLSGYRRSSGTSHAAPFASAAAALVIAAGLRRGRRPSPEQVRAILLSTARPRAPGGPDVLDAAAAVRAASDPGDPTPLHSNDPTTRRTPWIP